MLEKPYHYKDCGLDYIYLLDGVITKETPHGSGTAIVNAEELHAAIAKHIVTSPRPLCGQEVRFLRSILRLSQTSLARTVGVDRSTVARWESEPHEPIPEMAATAVRLIYGAEQDTNSVIKQVMEMRRAEDDDDASVARVNLSSTNGWHRAA